MNLKVVIAERSSVDLTSAGVHEIALPDELSLSWPANRPIIVVHNGQGSTAKLVQKLPGTVVVMSFSSVSGLSCSSLVVNDRSEKSLVSALDDVIRRFGVPGGFIYQHDPSSLNLGWAMLAAKHLHTSLNQPIANGRAFFMGVVNMDGRLGLSSFGCNTQTF